MRQNKHDVKVTFVTASGAEIIRTVSISGSRSRGEARARVAATAAAYVPADATVKGVTL